MPCNHARFRLGCCAVFGRAMSSTSSLIATGQKRTRDERQALLAQLAISFALKEEQALNVVPDIDQDLLSQTGKKGCPPIWVAKCWTAHRGRIMREEIPAVEWPSFYDEGKRCWCCGRSDRKLQKCHIVPKSIGGADAWSNIIPMCSICHDKAPDVGDPVYLFNWIREQANPFTGLGFGHMWQQALWFQEEIKTREIPREKEGYYRRLYLDEVWRLLMEKASTHAAQSNAGPFLKMSTWEWVIRKACNVFPNKIAHLSPFL